MNNKKEMLSAMEKKEIFFKYISEETVQSTGSFKKVALERQYICKSPDLLDKNEDS